MTFERFIALFAVMIVMYGWNVLAYWKVWGLWPQDWGWWTANVIVMLVLTHVISKLVESKE